MSVTTISTGPVLRLKPDMERNRLPLKIMDTQPQSVAPPAPMRILIVDDSEDYLNLLSEFVRLCSISTGEIVCAATGEEGLEQIEKAPFDCVLLDFDLPGINGVEVLRRGRELHPHLCVVMVTAKGDEQVAVDAMKSGALDYLVKGNVSKQTLERVLINCFERRQLVEKIADQERQLIHHEHQRVLFESIGATCHHFSQPITSLLGRLELLLERNPPLDEDGMRMLRDCHQCTQDLQRILYRFQQVREYKTVPYTDKMNIIDID
jgi:DNA-binding response OmpR family regulator